jgi:hypothetical protein
MLRQLFFELASHHPSESNSLPDLARFNRKISIASFAEHHPLLAIPNLWKN